MPSQNTFELSRRSWPFAFAEKKLEKPEGTPQPLRMPDGAPNPIWTIRMEYLETWRALESFVAAGKCKSSNAEATAALNTPSSPRAQLHSYMAHRAASVRTCAAGCSRSWREQLYAGAAGAALVAVHDTARGEPD